MARPKNQEARRSQLKLAAGRAIAARGLAGVRVQDVAREAGMAPASVLYYYPDLDSLLRDAFLHALHRFHDRRREHADAIDDARRRLVETIRAGFPTGPDDVEVVVLYESVPFAREDPALAALVRTLTARQVAMYEAILEAGRAQGHFELADAARPIAQNLVALEDAYGLYIVGGAEQLPVEEAIGLVLSFARMATRCDLPKP